ncbi:hypothetical protein GCM10010251_96110 [Streptomyces aurantiogriseus]|uniref:Uncharacterized protein n=1 Tax=Streptomyces aurantiogriseus TaxID=66870 RepID=A0A918L0H7_9ACTN|nr:hypothetical protein GCM10010251_96110 [Streptomyces aurantiogriseus]
MYRLGKAASARRKDFCKEAGQRPVLSALVAGAGGPGGAAVRFALGLAGEGDGECDYSLRSVNRPKMSTYSNRGRKGA